MSLVVSLKAPEEKFSDWSGNIFIQLIINTTISMYLYLPFIKKNIINNSSHPLFRKQFQSYKKVQSSRENLMLM